MTKQPASFQDPKIAAAIDMLRRTGLRSFQIRYQDDEQPTVWIAVGVWGDDLWECAAASSPAQAVAATTTKPTTTNQRSRPR
jgi:hypothetical protein